jgi:hypothetical protein
LKTFSNRIFDNETVSNENRLAVEGVPAAIRWVKLTEIGIKSSVGKHNGSLESGGLRL